MIMHVQEMTNWCWAAVTASVNDYCNPHRRLTQCEVVQALFGRGQRCEDNNVPAALDKSLRKLPGLDLLVLRTFLPFTRIQEQIDLGFPVCVRIGWPDGTGHFVAIDAYGQTPDEVSIVHVIDPWYEDGVWTYDEFCNAYQGTGAWTSSYLLTKKEN
jgi:hypothetical protein